MPTRGKVRIVAHRRRREGRTDFRQRLALVKSGKPRFVVRKTVNSMTCQFVKHDSKGDMTVVSVSSRNLPGLGWKGSPGNIPAAYLTGFLCGIQARKSGLKEAVLDIGLQTSTKGSRIYGALKGAVDAGIAIPHSEDILPPIERIRGVHIEQFSESVGKKREVASNFDAVKKAIESGSKPSKPATKPAAKKAPANAQKGTRKPAKK
jgi:large subunit ribosomal protein L18